MFQPEWNIKLLSLLIPPSGCSSFVLYRDISTFLNDNLRIRNAHGSSRLTTEPGRPELNI